MSSIKSNDEMQDILSDILANFKLKFIQPVLSENTRLMAVLEEIKVQDRAGIQELKERVDQLERKMEEIPLLVLSAIRDAVNQASGEV